MTALIVLSVHSSLTVGGFGASRTNVKMRIQVSGTPRRRACLAASFERGPFEAGIEPAAATSMRRDGRAQSLANLHWRTAFGFAVQLEGIMFESDPVLDLIVPGAVNAVLWLLSLRLISAVHPARAGAARVGPRNDRIHRPADVFANANADRL
jgi:hypothetical protein